MVWARLSLIRIGCVQEPVRRSRAAEIMCECVFQMIPNLIPNRYHFDSGVRPNRPIAVSVPSRTEANRTCASSGRTPVCVLNHTEELGITVRAAQQGHVPSRPFLPTLLKIFNPLSSSSTSDACGIAITIAIAIIRAIISSTISSTSSASLPCLSHLSLHSLISCFGQEPKA